MQVAIHSVSPGDARALEELNRFLRGHRVLSLDRQFHEGTWSFCVTWLQGPIPEDNRPVEKVDYKTVLDEKTFTLFSRLRLLRKSLAEKEGLPPYAVFTNEQLASIANARCAQPADLAKIQGVGPSRVDKYGAAVLETIIEHGKQQSPA